MKGATIDFGPSIQAHAKARNQVLTPDEIASLAETLNGTAEIETGDHPALTFAHGGDRRGDLNAALDLYATGYGKPAGAETGWTRTVPTALKPEAQTATQKAIARNAELRAGSADTKRHQAEQLVKALGSPWITGNRTHQAYVQNTHPELAQRLKREAGRQP